MSKLHSNQTVSRERISLSRPGLTIENTSKENLEIMQFVIKQTERLLTERRNE